MSVTRRVENMFRRGKTEELVRADLRARGCPGPRVSQLMKRARVAGLPPEKAPAESPPKWLPVHLHGAIESMLKAIPMATRHATKQPSPA